MEGLGGGKRFLKTLRSNPEVEVGKQAYVKMLVVVDLPSQSYGHP